MFFTTAEIINHYKSQVLSGIDFTTPAIYHAPELLLRVITEVQHNFLNEMGLSRSEAFMNQTRHEGVPFRLLGV